MRANLNLTRRALTALVAASVAAFAAGDVLAQDKPKPFEPTVGQPGRDTPWVPTPDILVQKMLDMAKLTPDDYVIDLGSGDGRMVIAAAKRGARGHGVEYNPKMVEYSNRAAAKAGVADRARFVQGDMYKADISKATVLPLFLLSENLQVLTPKFLELRPGTRIVTNGFEIPAWRYDETETVQGDCGAWCTAYLYIVPAKVEGTWRLANGGELRLKQTFQELSGTLSSGGKSAEISDGRLNGDRIRFTAGGAEYTGRVAGDTISGTVTGSPTASWTATRTKSQ
jgi:SAM-dependent methyltransferase